MSIGHPCHLLSKLYGSKIEGLVRLDVLRATRSGLFNVTPHHPLLPSINGGRIDEREFNSAISRFTQGLTEYGILMARSSGLTERPGANPTLRSIWDPNQVDRSTRNYLDITHRLFESAPDMGVALTKMVGKASAVDGGRILFGRTNVSFVADTHHPSDASKMHIALVHGLGTSVVESGSGFISVVVDRESGRIEHVVNKNREEAMLPARSVRTVQDPRQYAQHYMDQIDLRDGADIREAIAEEFLHSFPLATLKNGRIQGWYGERPANGALGRFPLINYEGLNNLIGSMQYIAQEEGPTQIEGAFQTPSDDIPWIYQLLRVALPPLSNVQISDSELANAIVTVDLKNPSSLVGCCDWSGPLLITDLYGEDLSDKLIELERKYGESGYALLVTEQDRDTVNLTPNCRIRLSSTKMNPSCHAMTEMRIKMSERPNDGYVFADNVIIRRELLPRLPLWRRIFSGFSPYILLPTIHIKSNGKVIVAI